MKAVSYCRVSSQEQIQGTSLESQQQTIKSYCSMRGIELVGVFVDGGVSGGIPLSQRPQGGLVVQALASKTADALIVCKLDRAFRSASDCLVSVEQWEKIGVRLVVLNLGGEVLDTSTPTAKFFLTIMSAAAELEKNLIRERCNEGRRNRKSQGKRIGEVPFGFNLDLDGKTLLPNPNEQATLSLIRDLHGQGHTLRGIAQELNSRRIKPKKGLKWTHTSVRSVLQRMAA